MHLKCLFIIADLSGDSFIRDSAMSIYHFASQKQLNKCEMSHDINCCARFRNTGENSRINFGIMSEFFTTHVQSSRVFSISIAQILGYYKVVGYVIL